MKCPECTSELSKNVKDGEGVTFCSSCSRSWFILCTSTSRQTSGTAPKMVDRGRIVSIKRDRLPVLVVDALIESGLADSKTKARNLINGGAVKLNEDKVTSIEAVFADLAHDNKLWAGKKNFVTISIEE